MLKYLRIFFFALLTITSVNFVYAQTVTENTTQSSADKPAIDPDFQKMLDDSKKSEGAQTSLKDDVEIKTVDTSKAETVEKIPEPTYPKTILEILIPSLMVITFLLLNFVCSALFPKFRYLFIATPFDIGVREIKTDAQNAVKKDRVQVETGLLVVIIIFYAYFVTGNKGYEDERLDNRFIQGLVLIATSYVFYIVVRLWVGLSSKCPSCKNMFAETTTNIWSEPKSTYQKRGLYSGTDGRGVRHVTVTTMEVGINHSDHLCQVCGHEWHVAKTYKKSIGTHTDRE
jgi:hypothetical protein